MSNSENAPTGTGGAVQVAVLVLYLYAMESTQHVDTDY
jgi:hypothetical protein